MTTQSHLQQLTAPSENWDDDFEFQGDTNATNSPLRTSPENIPDFNPPLPTSATRMSTASSHLTEDWDADTSHHDSRITPTMTNATLSALEDQKNFISYAHTSPAITTSHLAEWVEPGPSKTLARAQAENWDDDFEDRTNSPAKKSKKSAPTTPTSKLPRQSRPGPQGHSAPRPESWDDESDFTSLNGGPSPDKPFNLSPGKRRRDRRGPIVANNYYSSDSEEERQRNTTSHDDQLDLDFGFADKEEDRTVTARSRRAALSRIIPNNHIDTTPPPPLPPLPFINNITNQHPLPRLRSPTSSVFSAPASSSSSHLQQNANSTTHLHPTASRTSFLSNLPPSPPIHKERERRRLRKKSRPPSEVQNHAGYDYPSRRRSGAADNNGYGYPLSSIEGAMFSDEGLARPITPHTPPRTSTLADASGSAHTSASGTPATGNVGLPGLSSPGGTRTLLSRIGSVKKWGVRKKRESTTPSEFEDQSKDLYVHNQEEASQVYHNLTPRPQSSLSSLPASSSNHDTSSNSHGSSIAHGRERSVPRSDGIVTGPSRSEGVNTTGPNPPPSNPGWFFRASSAGSPRRRGNHSLTDLVEQEQERQQQQQQQNHFERLKDRERERGTMYTPTPDGGRSASAGVLDTPSKLLKRKSLGFVHLRGLGGNKTVAAEPSGKSDKRPVSMQPTPHPFSGTRSPGYGGLGLGRVGIGASVDNLTERERDLELEREKERDKTRKRSFSGTRPRDISMLGGDLKDKPKEGSRGFLGGVRKISLVGRHKRTKSGVSLSNAGEALTATSTAGSASTSSSSPPLPSRSSGPSTNATTPKRSSSFKRPIHPPPQPPNTLDMIIDSDKTPSNSRVVHGLLPPIELHPPSPPGSVELAPNSALSEIPSMSLETLLASSTETETPRKAPSSSPKVIKTPKTPGSPQSASLGRSAVASGAVSGLGPGSGGSGSGGSGGLSGLVARRNSLGDLKIPARISQAQVGLRRDLGMVRDFAANVEQLKELQTTYHTLVLEVQAVLDKHAHLAQQHQPSPPSRAASPSFFNNLSRPMSRNRSNTNPSSEPPAHLAYKQLASAFYTINSKYRISWECAELLIELGGGTPASPPPPPSSISEPIMKDLIGAHLESRKSRERAITLAGDESKPSTPTLGAFPHGLPASSSTPIAHSSHTNSNPLWRASTGRHDLSVRQLSLLKEMLNRNNASFVMEDSHLPIAEENHHPSGSATLHINRDWRWGDAMSSTVTLPSDDHGSGSKGGGPSLPVTNKKRRLGMTGLRDMLRSLKKSHQDGMVSPLPPPLPASSTSLSTESSLPSQSHHQYPHGRIPSTGRRRAKTSSGPEIVKDVRPTSPYGPSSLSTKQSPRRPSLASIFRLGKSRPPIPALPAETSSESVSTGGAAPTGRGSTSTGEEEDWDRIDSASDLDGAPLSLGNDIPNRSKPLATVRARLKKPDQQRLPTPQFVNHINNDSQVSLHSEERPSRTTRLSNVDESPDPRPPNQSRTVRAGPVVKPIIKSGSVRSMPPQPMTASSSADPKLAMTPENIKPLLENTREVHAKLNECISEIKELLTNASSTQAQAL